MAELFFDKAVNDIDCESLDLLELVQYIIGCEYLSDLKYDPYNSRAKILLQNISFDHYSLNQIRDTINYIYFQNK